MTTRATQPERAEEVLARAKSRAWYIDLWIQLVKTKPLATIGLVIMLFFLVIGIFATWIAPEGINEPNLDRIRTELDETQAADASQPDYGVWHVPGPSWRHPMGLDINGRDFMSLVIHGGRTSVLVGIGTVAFGIFFGAVLGVASAWFGGKFDLFIQRIVDAWLTFPALPVLITLVTILPTSVGFMPLAAWAMTKIIIALGILWTPWNSRIIRSAALVVKESEYVTAARALGANDARIVFGHIMPNVAAPIITLATLSLGGAILYEASLSFLGYGVPPPNPTWGGMLTMSQVTHVFNAPWLAVFPGIAISLVVLGINLLGDGLRDLLDPRLRGQT